MQVRSRVHAQIPLLLVVAMLAAVVSGTFMLTCVEDAHAVAAPPTHAGGSACLVHEGHVVTDVALAVETERTTTFDLDAASHVSTVWLAFSDMVEAPGVLAAPLYALDSLHGRLLL